MPVMFMPLQKRTFDGKLQICQISLLPTDSVINYKQHIFLTISIFFYAIILLLIIF
jgi:hypothetical protein